MPFGIQPSDKWQGKIISDQEYTEIPIKKDYYEAFDYLILRVLKQLK